MGSHNHMQWGIREFLNQELSIIHSACNSLCFVTKLILYPILNMSRVRIPMDLLRAHILSVIMFCVVLASATTTTDVNGFYYSQTNMEKFIKTSCNVTSYRQLCISSLSSYMGPLKVRQSDLVKAVLMVSLVNARNVLAWVADLEAKESAALKDCVENFYFYLPPWLLFAHSSHPRV